jgi:hypothetical protein
MIRAFPALNCDEVKNRLLIGWSGALVLCVGLPLTCMRSDGPYGTLPLSDSPERPPSQLCDNPDLATPGPTE